MSTSAAVHSARACFADYAEKAISLDEVAKFCRVQVTAVITWVNGDRWPRGEPQYLLWAFLEFRGYKVAELEQLPEPSHQLLLIIAMGELSFEDVRVELTYRNMHDVYRLIRQGGGLTKERAWKLEALVKRHLPSLKSYRNEHRPIVINETVRQVAEIALVEETSSAPERSSQSSEPSSLARLLRLVVRRSTEVEPDELKRQLRDVPSGDIEAFALLLLELV